MDTRYWSKDFITEFLELYKQHPCLWKIKSKEYCNKNLKNAAYDELTELCKTVLPSANRDYVVKKIQSFRGSFRKELKKVTESKRSGASEDDLYIPSLWYFDLLKFTMDQELPTDSISNMGQEKSAESTKEKSENYFDGDFEEADEKKTPFSLKVSKTKVNPRIRKNSAAKRNNNVMEYCNTQLEKNVEIDEYDAVAKFRGRRN